MLRRACLEIHDADRADAQLVIVGLEQGLDLRGVHAGELLGEREDVAHRHLPPDGSEVAEASGEIGGRVDAGQPVFGHRWADSSPPAGWIRVAEPTLSSRLTTGTGSRYAPHDAPVSPQRIAHARRTRRHQPDPRAARGPPRADGPDGTRLSAVRDLLPGEPDLECVVVHLRRRAEHLHPGRDRVGPDRRHRIVRLQPAVRPVHAACGPDGRPLRIEAHGRPVAGRGRRGHRRDGRACPRGLAAVGPRRARLRDVHVPDPWRPGLHLDRQRPRSAAGDLERGGLDVPGLQRRADPRRDHRRRLARGPRHGHRDRGGADDHRRGRDAERAGPADRPPAGPRDARRGRRTTR